MRPIPQKWKMTIMLFGIAALNYGDRTAIASVFPLLRADLRLSDLMLAGIGSAFLWSYAIGSPIAGYLADRLPRSRMVLFSLVAWSSVMVLTGFVHSSAVLLTTRVLLGLAECIYLPAATALIADHHAPDTRGTAMSIQVAGMQSGLVGGSAIAGYLGERLGWRADFFILGGAGLLLALIAVFILRDGPQAAAPTSLRSANLRHTLLILRNPGYISVVAGAMLIAAGTWIFLNWLPLYFHERFHLSLAGAGFSSSSMLQVAAVLGVMIGGVISDRTAGGSPRARILLLAICYFCAAPFLLAFRSNGSLSLINGSIFCYSFFQSLGSASESPIICEVVGPRLRSTALGLLNMVNCFSGGLGVMFAGILKRDYGLAAAFSSVSVTVTLAGLVVLTGYFLVRRNERLFSAAAVYQDLVHTGSGILDESDEKHQPSLAPPRHL